MNDPQFIFIAGCNAAGKTSFIRSRISQLPDFEIIMTDVFKGRTKDMVRTALKKRKNIILETVFNDQSFIALADEAKTMGYKTSLIVLFLDTPKQSVARVAARSVEQSGLVISGTNVITNFNESFKNIASYYFYFDQADFLYTGQAGRNEQIMRFRKMELINYRSTALQYPQKFSSFAYNKQRMNEDAYRIIQSNKDFNSNDAGPGFGASSM